MHTAEYMIWLSHQRVVKELDLKIVDGDAASAPLYTRVKIEAGRHRPYSEGQTARPCYSCVGQKNPHHSADQGKNERA